MPREQDPRVARGLRVLPAMRPVPRMLSLLVDGPPVPVQDVTVVPLAGAGMLTDVVEGEPAPPGAAYVARARGRALLVDNDEMCALRDAGAKFDLGAGD